MGALRLHLWTVILAIPLVSPVSLAQEQSGTQATSADRPIDTRIAPAQNKNRSQDQDADLQGPSPDTRSLAGAQELSLGDSTMRRSFWQPLLSVTSTVDTNPLTSTTTQTSNLTTWSSGFAGIDLRRISRRSDLTLSYVGGGLISNDGTAKNSVVQQFGLGEKLVWGRSIFSLFDVANQLPETSFGFSLPGSVRLPGGQGVSLEPIFTPNQSILTTRGQRVGNTSVLEVDRALTPRSSLTFVGAYSLLRFLDNSSFVDYSETTFQGGYEKQVTRYNTLALLYRFAELRFSGTGEPIDAHAAQLSFGRRDAGRFAFRLAGGPGVSFFRTVSPAGSTSPTSSSKQIYWTLDTSMTYQKGRSTFGLEYDHSLSGGGGVLPGATTDQASGSLNSQFSKALVGGMAVGYARNQALNSPLTPASAQLYNYWFSRVNLSHPWGRWTTLDLSYQVQFQDSNANFCIGATCGKDFVRQTGSIGFNWRSRPIPIE